MHRSTPALIASLAAFGLAAAACELDGVEYGDPGGLRLTQNAGIETCEVPAGSNTDACPDWATTVYPIFDSEKYGCTNSGCHGDPGRAAGLYMPEGDPATGYANMAAYKALDGSEDPSGEVWRYINPGGDGYLLCNLNPDKAKRVGTLMPIAKAAISGDDLVTIGNWYLCGQLEQGGGGMGGAGGLGGAGGQGGAGGAGGGAGGGVGAGN